MLSPSSLFEKWGQLANRKACCPKTPFLVSYMSDAQICDWSCAHRISQNGWRYKENHEVVFLTDRLSTPKLSQRHHRRQFHEFQDFESDHLQARCPNVTFVRSGSLSTSIASS
ncbi:hypothetical protein QUB16_03280 [Microcoleus sp. D3_18a_C4]